MRQSQEVLTGPRAPWDEKDLDLITHKQGGLPPKEVVSRIMLNHILSLLI